MPKSSDRLALTRQWHLLRKIPTYGVGLTINELKDLLSSQGIEVTKRTVERDLCYLANPRGGGWPIQVDVQSKPYRWKWLNSKGLGLPGLEIADAVAATLAKDIVHQLLPATLAETLKPKFEQAQRVLEANQSKNRFAQWADNVRYLPPSLPFLPPTVSEGVRKGVHEGLLKGLQLAVRYDSPDRTEYNDSILHPLGLIQKGPVAYLVATTLDYYPDVRLYVLHRMRWAKLTTDPTNRPADFSLDAFIAGGGMEFGCVSMIQLKARVSDKLACYLEESKLSEDQQLRSDNGYVLTATLKDSWLLSFWILSQGEDITVISPASLRSRIGATLRAAAANYPVD